MKIENININPLRNEINVIYREAIRSKKSRILYFLEKVFLRK